MISCCCVENYVCLVRVLGDQSCIVQISHDRLNMEISEGFFEVVHMDLSGNIETRVFVVCNMLS